MSAAPARCPQLVRAAICIFIRSLPDAQSVPARQFLLFIMKKEEVSEKKISQGRLITYWWVPLH